MIEIPQEKRDKWVAAWKWLTIARDYLHGSGNADHMLHASDLIVWALAGWDRSEFEREHERYTAQGLEWSGEACTECGTKNWDERHTWTDEQWQQVRRERLEKAK